MTRQSNFELLRIISMLFIVIHHVIVHIFGLYELRDNSYVPLLPESEMWGGGNLLLINSLVIIGVNLFILITGYFSVNLKWKTLTNLYFLCVFYVSLALLACTIAGFEHKLFYWYKPFLLFHRTGSYWFMGAYVALVTVSPLINQFLRSITDRQLTHSVILLVIFNCVLCWFLDNAANTSHTFMQLVFMYITGAWLRRCRVKDKFSVKQLLGTYLFASFAIWAVSTLLFSLGKQRLSYVQFDYNSPFVVISAISFFLLFAKFNLKSAFINRIAQSVIAVYLIQEGLFGKEAYTLMREYMVESDSYLLPSVAYVAAVFTVAILIDQIRILLFTKAARIIADRLTRKFPLESYF